MIRQNRKWQGPLACAMLFILMIGALFPDPMATPLPVSAGRHTQEWSRKKLVRYFRTQMNYAGIAPFLRGYVLYQLGISSARDVFIGKNGHLYFSGENAANQSAGLVRRASRITHLADMASVLQKELARRNIRLVFAIPPNATSVAVEDLPDWFTFSRPDEYDLAMTLMQQRSVPAADLRGLLLARHDGNALYYRTDTHWNFLGATLAFNLTMHTAGLQKWHMDPSALVGAPIEMEGQDLARLIGLKKYLSDRAPPEIPLQPQDWETIDIFKSPPFDNAFFAYTYRRKAAGEGERVLVLGDSFTMGFWLPLFQRTDAAQFGWLHHGVCTFDFNDVERFQPTLVILAPTERQLPCPLENWPVGLPRS